MDGFQLQRRTITASGTVTVLSTDVVIAIDKTVGGATPVLLPVTSADGKIYIIKDEKGDANTNNITLTPDRTVNSDTIEGSNSYVMNLAKSSAMIQYDASTANWMVLAVYNGTAI
jgi:hypothetical protein